MSGDSSGGVGVASLSSSSSASSNNQPLIILRSSTGLQAIEGPESYKKVNVIQESASCRRMLFSNGGQYFAWTNGSKVEVVRCSNWSKVCSLPHPKTQELMFSPQSTYIVIMELYAVTKENPQGAPNIHVYKVEDGSHVSSYVNKKHFGWQPSFSSDDRLFGRMKDSEVQIFENIAEPPTAKLNCAKVASFSMSPTPSQKNYLVSYMPGKSGMPSFVRLFQYPKFDIANSVANKGFFQGESVQFHWNDKGNSVLIMTSTESDKTGGSYYGRQQLHFLNTKGDTSMVQLAKEGPIHDVKWSPKGQEFCVVYGTMPAKGTLFNLKCNPVYEFGTAYRNSIYFSPNANRLLLCGFGDLSGKVEVWDMESKKQTTVLDARDTVGIHWDPRSECFIGYTVAPRLRVDNGFKVYHATGTLIHEMQWPSGQELYELQWQPGNFAPSTLATKKPKAVASSKPVASKEAYRPPSARGAEPSFRLSDNLEKAHKPGQPTISEAPSKAALKTKKKRDAKKAKKAEELANSQVEVVTNADPELPVAESNGGDDNCKTRSGGRTYDQRFRVQPTNDPEKDKKIKNIIKKLEAISKLKAEQAEGKTIDPNQQAKISKENDLLKELGDLFL